MKTQVESRGVEEKPRRTSDVVHRLMGDRAVAGALARMSTVHNHEVVPQGISSPVEFGQWDDWDNGHTDG